MRKALRAPRAILLLSAHFEAPVATITSGLAPGTIHDFGGFPEALYELRYPAPGDPELAEAVRQLLEAAGIPVEADAKRGFDHGAWVPLLLMYPQADVPLVQLSIDVRQGPGYHYRLGKLLEPLRDDGVMIIGSGSATHNLREFFRRPEGAESPDWVSQFNEWLADAVSAHRVDDLLQYRERGPHAVRNHPTEEHYMPLLGALGAARSGEQHSRVHHSYSHGVLSMDVYQFGGAMQKSEHQGHGAGSGKSA